MNARIALVLCSMLCCVAAGWAQKAGTQPATASAKAASAPTSRVTTSPADGYALFQSLWQQRGMFNQGMFHPSVVQLPDNTAVKLAQNGQIKLRMVRDFNRSSPTSVPADITVQYYSGGGESTMAPGRSYLSMMYCNRFVRQAGAAPTEQWNAQPLMSVAGRQQVFLPCDGPDSPLVKAIEDLLFTAEDKHAKEFDRMMECLSGPDPGTAGFAAGFAGINGWGFVDDEAHKSQADRLGLFMVQTKDAALRGLVAKMYPYVRADLLPRDTQLLKRLLEVDDPAALCVVLENLRYALKRADDLAPILRPSIVGKAAPAARLAILRGLSGWKEKAIVFRDELEAIVRGKIPAERPERLAALHALIDAKADNAAALVVEMAGELPSAVGLDYAVEQKLYAIVPVIMQAAGEKKLDFGPGHAAGLSLLTRVNPNGTQEQFEEWWQKLSKDGKTKAMVEAGFQDEAQAVQAKALLAKLESSIYAERQAARVQLEKIAMGVYPTLTEAAKSLDAEVAATVQELIANVDKTLVQCRKQLTDAAALERQSLMPVPAAQPSGPGTLKGIRMAVPVGGAVNIAN